MTNKPKNTKSSPMDEAVQLLLAHGFVQDGETRTENVRISTTRSPVFGGTGGEARTFGGRSRFRLPSTDVRATVGPRTINVYRVVIPGHSPLFLANLKTRDLDELRATLKNL